MIIFDFKKNKVWTEIFGSFDNSSAGQAPAGITPSRRISKGKP